MICYMNLQNRWSHAALLTFLELLQNIHAIRARMAQVDSKPFEYYAILQRP